MAKKIARTQVRDAVVDAFVAVLAARQQVYQSSKKWSAAPLRYSVSAFGGLLRLVEVELQERFAPLSSFTFPRAKNVATELVGQSMSQGVEHVYGHALSVLAKDSRYEIV